MGKYRKLYLLLVLSILALGLNLKFAMAEEESFDLNEISNTASSVQAPPTPASVSKINIMGRVDLTMDDTVKEESELKQNHFLLFLKIQASPKVSFMGEFVAKTFAYVDYQATKDFKFTFGKVLVPFGDSRYFHKYYGGLQGYGAQGVMFPNIWAEPGLIASWSFQSSELDGFWVNGITAPDATSDVDFQSSTNERQAMGLRWSKHLPQKLDLILSTYYDEYWPGRPLYLGGLDFSTSYGSFGLKNVRLTTGFAHAFVEGLPGQEDFKKTGDYLQISTNAISNMEWRIRYGTYDDDDRIETQADTNSLNLGTTFNVDVIKVLVEYQWNFEAIQEVNNDVARAMASLDF